MFTCNSIGWQSDYCHCYCLNFNFLIIFNFPSNFWNILAFPSNSCNFLYHVLWHSEKILAPGRPMISPDFPVTRSDFAFLIRFPLYLLWKNSNGAYEESSRENLRHAFSLLSWKGLVNRRKGKEHCLLKRNKKQTLESWWGQLKCDKDNTLLFD